MAICPQCKQTLPDWSELCQFCGAKVVITHKSATNNPYARGRLAVPSKVIAIYTIGAVFWVLDGIVYILNIIGFPNIGKTKLSGGMVPFIALAAATTVVGFLLLVKVKVAQKAVRVVAWANIVLGVIALFNPLFSAWTWWVIVNLVCAVLQVVLSGYMIYSQGVIDLYED